MLLLCNFTLPITHRSKSLFGSNDEHTQNNVCRFNSFNDSFFFDFFPPRVLECGTHKLPLREKLRAMNKFSASRSLLPLPLSLSRRHSWNIIFHFFFCPAFVFSNSFSTILVSSTCFTASSVMNHKKNDFLLNF